MVSEDTADSDRSETPTRVDDDTIVVPLRMYKGITVFSTLVATALVVFGFFLFDAATQPGNPIRRLVVGTFELLGWVPPTGVVDVAFGLLGVAVILLGAGSYILGSRFKTAEMVGGESDDGETSTDSTPDDR